MGLWAGWLVAVWACGLVGLWAGWVEVDGCVAWLVGWCKRVVSERRGAAGGGERVASEWRAERRVNEVANERGGKRTEWRASGGRVSGRENEQELERGLVVGLMGR